MRLVVGYLKVKQDQSPFASGGSNKIDVGTRPSAVAAKETVTQPAPKKEEAVTAAIKKEETASPVLTEAPTYKVEEVKVPVSNANYKGGYFKSQYAESGKTVIGNAGVFKSTSGWNDGKYYALMNNVPIGTIVKVTFSSTNKSIFAKVLGQLPEMKESSGLSIRLSDAAASELGVMISKFYVDVKY
jgi:hypothetical protein